jgi:hypothetical protein
MIGLHNDGSNEGSDNRERRHHQQQPILVQGFYPELTEPTSCLPTRRSQGYPASRRCQPPTHSNSPFGQWNIQEDAPRGKRHKSADTSNLHHYFVS